MLFHTGLEAGNLSWVHGKAPDTPVRCSAKIRYRQPDQGCTVEAVDERRIRVVFDRPQRAVTPGQSVVFYQDEECLGGGIIEHALDAAPASTSAFQAVA
jgi:tRNA-specific 2-thiouridylase